MALKAIVFCFISISFITLSLAQDQTKADSLFNLFQTIDVSDSNYYYILYRLSYHETDVNKVIEYANELIESSRRSGNNYFVVTGFMSLGQAHLRQSNFEEALAFFFKGLELAQKHELFRESGQLQSSIADIYDQSGNEQNAYKYYEFAIENLEKAKDSVSIATLYINLGDANFNNGVLDTAAVYFDKSLRIFQRLKNKEGVAFNLGNLGMVYAQQGKHELAEDHMNDAIAIFEEMENFYPISVFLTYIADIYVEKNHRSKALSFANRSLVLAKLNNLKNEISNAHKKLSEIHEHFGSNDDAYHHYKEHILMRDSVNNIETVEALANQRTEYEVSQKQGELDLVEQRRKTQRVYTTASASGVGFLSLMALLLYRNNRFEKKTNKIIAAEKMKSDRLLLNILPKETAKELKVNGKVKAKKFESVSVLFADFVGFTSYSKNLSPEEVVETIDIYFTQFDKIVEDLGLEKIKTIGDGYMCAGGLPERLDDHAIKLTQAACEMRDYVLARSNDTSTPDSFNVRIGIHSGPVVSGVVGSNKFAYDIWGDTVNTASRMESHSESGKVNVSQDTYELIKNDYSCTSRPLQEVKSKGPMQMYFIEKAL